jgi:hypothetical protein
VELMKRWNNYFRNKRSKYEFIFTSGLLIVILFLLSRFLLFVEHRPGIIPDDPLLKLFQPINLTWLTFLLIYGGLAIAIFYFAGEPERLVFAIQVYIVMVLVRIIAMYVVPFDPPSSMIQLKDPIVEYIGTGQQMNKDLFFSGHTATMFLLYLTSGKKYYRILFFSFTIIVAICVLIQHVHYAIDVFAAPFFTFGSYYLVCMFKKKFFNDEYLYLIQK